MLILNDDAVLQVGSLGLMLRKLDSDPKIGAIGPKLLNPDGSLQQHFTNRRFPHIRGIILSFLGIERHLAGRVFWRDLLTLNQEPQRSGQTDHVAGACLLARRAALEQVSLFDERFHYWFEDTDLCCRLRRAGWTIIYLAEAPVIHYGSASLDKINESERTVMSLKSLMLFYNNNEGPWRCLFLRLSLMLVLLYRAFRIALHNLIADASKRENSKSRLRACLGLMRLVSMGPDEKGLRRADDFSLGAAAVQQILTFLRRDAGGQLGARQSQKIDEDWNRRISLVPPRDGNPSLCSRDSAGTSEA